MTLESGLAPGASRQENTYLLFAVFVRHKLTPNQIP